MNSANEPVTDMIDTHERTMLQPVDHAAFFAALDNPPAVTDKLRAAFARYREKIVNR